MSAKTRLGGLAMIAILVSLGSLAATPKADPILVRAGGMNLPASGTVDDIEELVAQAEEPIDDALVILTNRLNEMAVPQNVTLPSNALVLFSPNGEAEIAKPASIADRGVLFPVFVDGWMESEVGKVQVRSAGAVLGEATVDEIEDGIPSTVVRIDGIPAMPTNSYSVRLLDPLGAVLYESPPLAMWIESGSPEEMAAEAYFGACAALDASIGEVRCMLQFGDLPVPPVDLDPGASTQSCRPSRTFTWARQGSYTTRYSSYGNKYDVNDGPITSAAFVRPWTWGYNDDCGMVTQVGSARTWGVADSHSGKTDLVGTGGYLFGFTVDYSGGGKGMERRCSGSTCWYQGYDIYASNARSFMKTPAAGAPVWDGLHRVSIPSSSSSNVPTAVADIALEALASALSGWASTFTSVLGFAVPDNVKWKNYQEITRTFDGSPGGGIEVNSAATGKKFVSGEMAWRFNGAGRFSWDMHMAVDMHAQFNACQRCGWVEKSYTAYNDFYHVARVRLT